MKSRYNQLYDYLSAPELPESNSGAIVFGRQDPKVAEAYVDLAETSTVDWGIITGGVGKDSGSLTIPEAEYLAREVDDLVELRQLDLPPTFVETQASNGGENVRNSLDIIRRGKLALGAITAVAHGTSLRRLAAMAEHETALKGVQLTAVYRKPTNYDFNALNPGDQAEAIAEMKRLMDWPAKGWLREGSELELPADLVDFVQDVTKQ